MYVNVIYLIKTLYFLFNQYDLSYVAHKKNNLNYVVAKILINVFDALKNKK